MIDDRECAEIETLETQLLHSGMSIEEMARRYAFFLKKTVNEGALDNIASSGDLDLALAYINKAIHIDSSEGGSDREDSLVELWKIEKIRRSSGAQFVAFIRCIILCFATEEQWENDNTGDDTPLYFFFFFLDKTSPRLTSSLMEYFRHYA